MEQYDLTLSLLVNLIDLPRQTSAVGRGFQKLLRALIQNKPVQRRVGLVLLYQVRHIHNAYQKSDQLS